MDEITEKRLEREWRSVRVERFSTITEWRFLEQPARELAEATGRTGNGHKLADIGLTLWRAKVGRGAAWCYAETLNDALSDALSRAATSAT